MDKTYISKSKEDTWQLAEQILQQLPSTGCNVVALQGELGAGKTTFTQGLLTAAGAEGPFTSPTFVIMKKYDLNGQPNFHTVYHFDCYRVASRDILELGWQETVANPRNLIIVEWPERIEEILPQKLLRLKFDIKGEEEREITVNNQ